MATFTGPSGSIISPFALMLISYVLYQKKYTLDEPEYARICAELEQRKAKA